MMTQDADNVAQMKVYFDGSCPICRAEIEQLDHADLSGNLQFVDCSASIAAAPLTDEDGPTQAQMLNALHIQTNGQWVSGPDAFATIYRSVGLSRLAALWGSARLRPMVNLAYRLFVRFRPVLAWLGFAGVVRWFIRREVNRTLR